MIFGGGSRAAGDSGETNSLMMPPCVTGGSDLSISESGYSTSDTVSVSEYSNRIFMMSILNHILSDMVDTIRIRIRIRTEI